MLWKAHLEKFPAIRVPRSHFPTRGWPNRSDHNLLHATKMATKPKKCLALVPSKCVQRSAHLALNGDLEWMVSHLPKRVGGSNPNANHPWGCMKTWLEHAPLSDQQPSTRAEGIWFIQVGAHFEWRPSLAGQGKHSPEGDREEPSWMSSIYPRIDEHVKRCLDSKKALCNAKVMGAGEKGGGGGGTYINPPLLPPSPPAPMTKQSFHPHDCFISHGIPQGITQHLLANASFPTAPFASEWALS